MTFANDIKDIKNSNNLELARVKEVIDGDTIHLDTGYSIVSTRLYGIDCMETSLIHRTYHQAYDQNTTVEKIMYQGQSAKKILNDIIKDNNRSVYFKTVGVDHYGRLLAIIYDKNFKNINNMLTQTPYCIPYMPSDKSK